VIHKDTIWFIWEMNPMMKLNEWQMMRESFHTLGLSRPSTLGLMGSRIQEWDDDDDDEEEDDYDGEQLDDDDDGLDGDVIGSSDADEGPDKNWPPDTEEEEDGLPTPDEENLGPDDSFPGDFAGDSEDDDDFLAAMGAGHPGDDAGFDGGFGGEGDFGGEGGLEDLEGLGGEGGFGGGFGDEEGGEGMDFLKDIDPQLLGGEGGEDGVGGEEGGVGGEPCPDCNPDGHEIGDPDCETCAGVGFLDDGGEEYGPELTGDEFAGEFGGDSSFGDAGLDDEEGLGLDDEEGLGLDGEEGLGLDGEEDSAFGGEELDDEPEDHHAKVNAMMAQYMKKYMRKEWYNKFHEIAPVVAAAAPAMAGTAGAGAAGAGAAGAGAAGAGGMGAMGGAAGGAAGGMGGMGSFASNPMMNQMAQQAAQGAGQQAMNNMTAPQQQQMAKRMIKFMSKKGERSFMAADAPKRKNKWKKHCPCESTQHVDYQCSDSDFLKSLAGSAKGQRGKGSSGITEDALFALADPNAEYAKGEPRPGDYGYAPAGRVGTIGGGNYSMDDFQELPTLGESVQYPTLAEYAAFKARKKAARRRRW
jgi:hypothetical protein